MESDEGDDGMPGFQGIYPTSPRCPDGKVNKMIEELDESRGCVLGFRFIGEITDEDYTEVFMPALCRATEKYGVVQLFVDISDLRSEDIGAMDEDVREESRVLYIEREAVVGDMEWEKKLSYVDHFFIFPNSDVRFFRKNCEQDAWDWIREGMKRIPMQAPSR